MTRRLFCLWIYCLCLLPLFAQSNKAIQDLKNRQGELQRRIAESETLLKTTRNDVGSQLKSLATLNGQLEERKRYIQAINNDLENIDHELATTNKEMARLQKDLKKKQDQYVASVRHLQKRRSIQDKLLFIFSAKNFAQAYRRLRYVREYADYQRKQGEDILKKQKEIDRKRAQLLQLREAKAGMLEERQTEMQTLEMREKEQAALVANLQRKQRDLQQELARQRQEAEQLNARIDQLIAEEIEKARKLAQEEARRKAAAEKAKQKKQAAASASSATPAPMEATALDKADRQLSGSFASNRGKLPAPITGSYLIVSHYGRYSVMRNVVLDNKGIDLQGHPGALARAVFNGKVAAVFQLNGLFNVLVRHGAYISVYCNLSRTTVKTGDTVSTRQTLGTVFSDPADNNRTVLHFQLRKETQKLNPELWIAR